MTPLESASLTAALIGVGVLAFRWIETRAGTAGALWITLMFISSTILLMDVIRG